MGIIKKKSFVSGAGVYLFSNILNGIIPFLLLPVLTRYLNPTQYGEVAMFQTLLGALSAFVGVTFVGAANRKYYDDGITKDELAQFIGACIQLILLFSLTVFLLLMPFQEQISDWVGVQSEYVLWAVPVSTCAIIVAIRLGQWQVQKQSVKYGILQISQSMMNMLLSLMLVILFLRGAEGRIDAQIITNIVFMGIAFVLLKKDSLLEMFSIRKNHLLEVLRFGVPLIPHTAGAFLLVSVDRFVINKELGLDSAGIYMVAVQITSAIGIVFDAINKAYVPWLFEKLKNDNIEEKKQIVKFTYIWFFLIFLGAAIAFIIGPILVTLVAGEEYARAGEVFGWLALGQGFQGMYLMVTNYIFYSKKTGLLSVASIGSGVLNLGLLIIFVRFFGLEGAAIAFATSMCIRFLLTWWIANKRHPMPWFNFI
jgi:O-antigen/teichoic acid export membrane protein